MYSIDFQIENGVLRASVCGVIASGEEAAAKARDVIDTGLKVGVHRILLDEREVDISIDVHEIISIARELVGREIPLYGGRMACLYRPEKKDLYKTYETIYQNRSLSYRLFDDPGRAMAWLRK
ncbi:hypothetical protein [Pseudodesulfovibrio portus]|uniref:STAS/SEC14 domain-containing protein n=1 Tax=Pseudodesulfovibrio portus TaxID=231439 RepID=A0ABN6RZ47_9BACT|nr:hypothetical protein [Pseudodesulfovibrio portus]BDQ35053.1 hypothetical protein JCM14722_25950 [Pseudodesulfovibrio portus]